MAGIRSVPATLRARLLGVIPSAAAFRIEGEFYQAQNHLDVSDQFRLVERSGEGPNLDSVSAGGQVREVEKVVAVSFAAGLRGVFIAVAFDLLCPVGSFAAFGAGRSVDGSFVVRDQRNQSGQGRGVAVPGNRYVQAARFVNPCAAFFDRVHRGLYVGESFVAAKNRRYKLAWFVVACLLLICTGCLPEGDVQVRSLPAPPPEQPIANLPTQLHQRNWTGRLNQGSCVHASLVNHLRWLNEFELGERWRATYSDGEWDSRLRNRLDAADIDYSYTVKADPRFLDWATATRRGAILWWKPAHCCTFVGWVNRDGRQYAAILDNNYPGRFELTPREQFVRLWAGYGGFALTVMEDPASSLPYRSYEVIDER
nr:hypothetical protein [Rhodopirellula sp. JC639]